MKKTIVLLSLAALVSSGATAHKHDFGVSVYDGFINLPFAGKKAAANTQKLTKSVFPGFYVTTDKLTGSPRDIYGSVLAVPGNDISRKAQYLLNNQLASLNIDAAEWKKMNEVNAAHASFVHFSQQIDGREVVFSQMSMRFTPSGNLQRIVLKTYGKPQSGMQPVLSAANVLNTKGMTSDVASVNISNRSVANDWVWFPIPTSYGYVLHPAWAFTITGTDKDDEAMPVELTGYIDATDGTVLYRKNNVEEEVNVVVKGSVYKDGVLSPATIEPLANLAITIGSNTNHTDDTGFYSNASLSPSQTAAVKLQGKWSIVRHLTSGGTTPSFNYNIAANGTTYTYPTTAPSSDAHVNAYYHTDRVHGYMKRFYPDASGFTRLDVALNTVVDIASTSGCNAFYNGSSINFYAENTACNSFAKVGDIVYHEYGHGINGRFYGFIKNQGTNSGMVNGGLNEGYADVWALGLTKNPVLGGGAFKLGGSIRTYNTAPKVYPKDRSSEVHANGEIIAGAWWDYSTNIGDVDSMAALFAKTLYDIPDGPEGTEGEVFHEVLVSAIMNDDDDNNLANGTPHFAQLTAAFARHGIYLMSDAALDHKEIAHQKDENTPIPVIANITLSEPAFFKSLSLIYRNRSVGTWDTVVLNNTGAGVTGGLDFGGQIPGQPAGSIIDYFFLTYDLNNNTAYSFPNRYNTVQSTTEVTLPYQFAIGLRKVQGTDFETDAKDWTFGLSSDNATATGKWTQAVPVASYWRPSGVSPYISQPGADNTTGAGSCLVTGNAASTLTDYEGADVDNGRTTVVSPIIDITGFNKPVIEYYRWYSNDQGPRDSNPRSDIWQAQVKDANSPIWISVDYTYQSDRAWRRRVFNVRDFLPNSNRIQVRFIAADEVITSMTGNGQNAVEAAIDDFNVYDAWQTSIQQVSANNGVKIYPNPANNTLNISLNNVSDNGNIYLYDLTGKQVAGTTISNSNSSYSINTAALPSGTYMIMIQNGSNILSQKVVISH